MAMRKEYCAGVCLLDNPFPIDGIYDYWIPSELEQDVRVGVFVTVPFGVANHRRLGLVMEVRNETAYADLKPIFAVCPEQMALDEEMMGLCRFLKTRILCSTGDAVRAMIPSAALSRLVTLYVADPEHIPTAESDDVQSSDLFVYTFVKERGEAAFSLLSERFGIGAAKQLKRLCDAGYLHKRTVLKDASQGKTERFYATALSREDCFALLDGDPVKGIRITGDAQKRVLTVLLESDCPLTAAELRRQAEVTDSPLQTLVKKGILATEEKRIDRNPYAAAAQAVAKGTPLVLSAEQRAAADRLIALARDKDAKAALLRGVTGSGKTSVMIELIDRLLEDGKGVILLLPEIALTPQSVAIFCARYGERVAVIHSALSQGERYDAYCRIRDGRADVVIGTRSAVFSPVRNLGAIIIDEEQEHTYKSDQNPKYHARDVARFRCAHNKALMLLASATPSLESYHKAKEGIYTLVTLKERYGGAKLPSVEVTDMRREAGGGVLSPLGEHLASELCRVTEAGEQSILFLNRRGYNHFVSCRSCGEALTCPRCSVALTYHTRKGNYREGGLVCHWCGHRAPLPTECPACHSPHLARQGFGTQRVEEELEALLPKARVLRMDTDTASAKFSYDRMLGAFRAHEADVLLGTQMVTKGHDFPDVTLVGVLMADSSLYLDDYRAAERTFAMLTQVIGRAGRGKREGRAIIQTTNPDSEIIRLACEQDYETFYEREIRLRRLLVFPPFCDIALLTVSGASESEVLRAATLLSAMVQKKHTESYTDVELVVFGPFEAPVYRVDNKYRMRMVIKCKLTRRTLALFAEILTEFSIKIGKTIHLGIDFNPSGL